MGFNKFIYNDGTNVYHQIKPKSFKISIMIKKDVSYPSFIYLPAERILLNLYELSDLFPLKAHLYINELASERRKKGRKKSFILGV